MGERYSPTTSALDESMMRRAISLARQAAGWTNPNPLVGAVVVKDGRIIGEGCHERYGELHAERNALAACGESPAGATLYVTLEPCPMCAGAIVQSRIDRVVIGCMNPKAGCAGSVLDILGEPGFNHQVQVTEGVLREDCSELMSSFFKKLREERKAEKLRLKDEDRCT